MADPEDSIQEHWVTKLKKGSKVIRDFAVALKTPVDQSEYILSFGKVTLNTQTGLFFCKNKKIQLRQDRSVYKIVRLLVGAMGNEVTYKEIAESVGLPDTKETKTKIGASIRNLRRQCGINSLRDRDKNIFIMTGKGIKLAYQA